MSKKRVSGALTWKKGRKRLKKGVFLFRFSRWDRPKYVEFTCYCSFMMYITASGDTVQPSNYAPLRARRVTGPATYLSPKDRRYFEKSKPDSVVFPGSRAKKAHEIKSRKAELCPKFPRLKTMYCSMASKFTLRAVLIGVFFPDFLLFFFWIWFLDTEEAFCHTLWILSAPEKSRTASTHKIIGKKYVRIIWKEKKKRKTRGKTGNHSGRKVQPFAYIYIVRQPSNYIILL